MCAFGYPDPPKAERVALFGYVDSEEVSMKVLIRRKEGRDQSELVDDLLWVALIGFAVPALLPGVAKEMILPICRDLAAWLVG